MMHHSSSIMLRCTRSSSAVVTRTSFSTTHSLHSSLLPQSHRFLCTTSSVAAPTHPSSLISSSNSYPHLRKYHCSSILQQQEHKSTEATASTASSSVTATVSTTSSPATSSTSTSSTPSTSLSGPPLFITTRHSIAGRHILRDHGLVAASAFRSRNLLIDVWVALTRIFGGETPDYTQLLNDCAEKALQRLEATARATGATSVVGVRFTSTTTMNRMIVGLHCSVLVSGTAVYDVEVGSKEYRVEMKRLKRVDNAAMTTTIEEEDATPSPHLPSHHT